MKLTIKDKTKKEQFIAIFQLLKNCSTILCFFIEENKIHLQGMDKSHVCLFDVNILNTWFDEYEVDYDNEQVKLLCFDTNIFHTVINHAHDTHSILIHTDDNSADDQKLFIDLIVNENSKGEFNKFFKIPLVDYDYDLLGLPEVDYDAEFTIYSKKICEIIGQMMVFGNDINIKCTEENINLITDGIAGEMLVTVPVDDLNEYSIAENEDINVTYSLTYIHKMCLTNKLSNNIDFFISGEYPMKIKYDLGMDSNLIFYIAPKITDN